jgi:hypothetical protein
MQKAGNTVQETTLLKGAMQGSQHRACGYRVFCQPKAPLLMVLVRMPAPSLQTLFFVKD